MIVEKPEARQTRQLITDGHLADGGRTEYDYKFHAHLFLLLPRD